MPKGIGYGPKRPPGGNKVSATEFRRRNPKIVPRRKPRTGGMKVTPIRRKVVTKRPRRM